jgi:hypothetical protein
LLCLAVIGGQVESVELLLFHVADTDIPNFFNHRPREIAIELKTKKRLKVHELSMQRKQDKVDLQKAKDELDLATTQVS